MKPAKRLVAEAVGERPFLRGAGGEVERLVGLDGERKTVHPDGAFGGRKGGGEMDTVLEVRMRELHVEWLIGRELEDRKSTVVFTDVAAGWFDEITAADEAGVGGERGSGGNGELEVAVCIQREERVREPLEVHGSITGVGDTTGATHGALGELNSPI